jgi:hypothetical protein
MADSVGAMVAVTVVCVLVRRVAIVIQKMNVVITPDVAMHVCSQSHPISEDGYDQPDFEKACKHGETESDW